MTHERLLATGRASRNSPTARNAANIDQPRHRRLVSGSGIHVGADRVRQETGVLPSQCDAQRRLTFEVETQANAPSHVIHGRDAAHSGVDVAGGQIHSTPHSVRRISSGMGAIPGLGCGWRGRVHCRRGRCRAPAQHGEVLGLVGPQVFAGHHTVCELLDVWAVVKRDLPVTAPPFSNLRLLHTQHTCKFRGGASIHAQVSV